MATDRTLSAAVGTCLLALAALVLASPAAERLVPTAAAVARLGNDYLLVAAVAGLVLATAVVVLLARTVGGVTEATPPAVEEAAPAAPGRGLDRALASLPAVRTTDGHRRIRDRLRTAAVDAVAETPGRSRAEARERVASGAWTDDATAAAFVANEAFDPPSTGRRVGARLRGADWFRYRVGRTVDAIETVREDRA